MRKLLLLATLSMLGVLLFSSVAMAEHNAQHVQAGSNGSPCPDPDYPRFTPDGCQASNLPDAPYPSASPTATPSAPPTATADSTASASTSATTSATASAPSDSQYAPTLPATGGPSVFALVAAVLLIGGGAVAVSVLRRR